MSSRCDAELMLPINHVSEAYADLVQCETKPHHILLGLIGALIALMQPD